MITIPSGMSEWTFYIFRTFYIFQIRRIQVLLPLDCQVACECFSFTPVPQTDLNIISSHQLVLRGCLPDRRKQS